MGKPRTATVYTPEFTLSHPHLLVPQQFRPKPGEAPRPPKYGCVAVFDAGADLSALYGNAREAKLLFFGPQAPRGLRSPFRKNEEAWKEDTATGKLIPEPGYTEGGIFISLDGGDRVAPECVDRGGNLITDASKLYPGCRCIAVVRAQGYNFEEKNKGVKFFLQALQKVGEGPNIAGRVSAKDYFKPLTGATGGAPAGETTGDGFGEDEDEF